MRLLFALLAICALFVGCASLNNSGQQISYSSNKVTSLSNFKDQLKIIKPGTARSEVLKLLGLTSADGASKVSYYADPCGSMEEWRTSFGERIYLQGYFLDQNEFRKEPYIIGIIKMPSLPSDKHEVLWSGINLHTGVDIFVISTESHSPENPQ